MPTGLRRGKPRVGTTRLFSLIVAVSLIAAMLLPMSAMQEVKAWSLDPATNTPICTAASDQSYPDLISDGSGSAIIVWQDGRSGTWDIYAQRANAAGGLLWMGEGLAVCTGGGDQVNPALASDGYGGAIIVWQDYRTHAHYDIYAQRVNAAGTPQWSGNGVAVCTYASGQEYPGIISDGCGGAIIVWQDYRNGNYDNGNYDVYAQRVDSLGAPLWTGNGVAVCTAAYYQGFPRIVSDGSGGAIIVWQDLRSHSHYDIYAQRVDAAGTPQWSGNGVAACTAFDDQVSPELIADGLGGAFIAWTDFRSGDCDVYAQRVDSLGSSQWTDGGLTMCNAARTQTLTDLESDGSGGVFMTWQDYRTNAHYDVYAQKVNPSGAPQWIDNGLAICTSTEDQLYPNAVADGSGGAIIAWSDYRSQISYDVYVQRVNAAGTLQWSGNGVAVSNAARNQVGPPMVGDGCGGAIITWMDTRSGNRDIYAQRVSASGALNTLPNQPASVSPNAGGTSVSVTPTLQSSPFSDPDSGNTHSASQWRITTTAGDYSSPVFDSGADSVSLLQISVPSGTLIGNTTYYWQVRHRDSRQDWSAWSAETSFTTENIIPSRPVNVLPATGASGAKLRAVLESSAFSDPSDAQAASQWRITAIAGDYSSPVFDSGTDNVSLLQIIIPPGKLKGSTTYYWQVRHQDSHGDWSEWSEESSFTTRKDPQTWIWIAAGAGAAAVLAGAIVTWLVLRRKKRVASQG